MTNRTALVAGAGIGGLAAAVALLCAGRAPVLVEEAPLLAPLEGSVPLDPDALAALDALGVGQLVRDRADADGAVAAVDLQTALLEQLGCGRIRLGREICCARTDGRLARLRLLTGDELAAPILVDATGAGSRVRAHVPALAKATRRSRASTGRIAVVDAGVGGLADAVALAAALADEPILEDALERYARSGASEPRRPRRRRLERPFAPRRLAPQPV